MTDRSMTIDCLVSKLFRVLQPQNVRICNADNTKTDHADIKVYSTGTEF